MLTLFICRSMNTKLVSQEEQITEYTERIAAMEEELKKVIFQAAFVFTCSSAFQIPGSNVVALVS